MGSFVRGSVASFRISEDFNQGHLDYLNASGGSKSARLAKYCSIGLKAEMDESIIINTKGLPVHIRDWLSESANVKLLVMALTSSNLSVIKNQRQEQDVKYEPLLTKTTEIDRPQSLLSHSPENETALNDFINQITSLGS